MYQQKFELLSNGCTFDEVEEANKGMKKLNVELEMRNDVYAALIELYAKVNHKYNVGTLEIFISTLIRNHIFDDLEAHNSVNGVH
jgi:hypothetical protein